ncbi:MAG: hypothetical protein BYD32DRAFT_61212 [Podila humilis]|nr:MAG: hypothetical protein BYD32DRAFT_61212 [Podila humilis]
MASLPPNLYIGSDLRATKILIDRPMTTHAQDGQSPSKSNVDGSTLSVDTSSTPPARIIGLEYTNRTGGVYRLFCKHGVLFANGKHHLIQSLDKHVISSFDSQDTKTLSEDPGSWPRMEFSIKMQYTRQQPSTLLARKARVSTWHLLQNLSNILGLLAFSGASYHSRTTLSLDPVILFRANRAHHKGRVQSWNPDCDDEAFELEISASTVSLETTSPVQISVKVVTEPVRDTFGNAEMIRKGEAVLMEGLDLARDMARGAGWTCLAEDDSQMIEWVRDQVIIQWSRPSQESIKNVSSTLEGLTMVFRSRSSSNGSTRTKTPTLSPYASRTHSLSGKRRSKHSGGHHRDSTLERLQEAAEMLEPKKEAHGLHALLDQQNPTRKVHRKSIDRGEPEKPIVSIAAAESPSPQRASVITSFGGFSSLSDSRTQSLALAEKTEDHLGLALSIPSVREPSSPTSNSPSPKEMDPKSITSFSEGITSVDILGTGYAPSPPEPKKLSRFSIKSYQLERNNTSTDWGLGNDMGLGSNAGSPKSTSPSTTTLSRFSAYNMSPASKPKLEAEVPTVDFLQDLGPPLNTPAKQDPVNNLTNGTGPRSFGGFRNGSISRVNGSHSGPIKSGSFEKPQESVPDFLGLALPSTNGPLDRIQSIQLNAPKTVHFADVNTKDLLRHDSDSGTLHEPSTEMGPASHSRPSLESIDSSGSSSSSTSNSKSKNHTRRSWGQGIGGNDILGIQGLA